MSAQLDMFGPAPAAAAPEDVAAASCGRCVHFAAVSRQRPDHHDYGACGARQGREREGDESPVVVSFAVCKLFRKAE